MKNVLILHGTGDNSQVNWFPWLKEELEKENYKVWVPDLPDANLPNLEKYNQHIFKNWSFDNDSIIVGHSSGAVAILGILQDIPKDMVIEKAIVVAGFKDDLGWDDLKELFLKDLDFQKIKTKAKKFIIIQSDDDPYIPMEHAEFLKDNLEGELIVLSNQKHFSVATGGEKYKQFPEVLDLITKES